MRVPKLPGSRCIPDDEATIGGGPSLRDVYLAEAERSIIGAAWIRRGFILAHIPL